MNIKATQYISPEEAAKIAGTLCIGDADTMRSYAMAFYNKFRNDGSRYYFYWFAAYLFNAGRIAGIRHERARRRRV